MICCETTQPSAPWRARRNRAVKLRQPIWIVADAADARRLSAAACDGPVLALTPVARAVFADFGGWRRLLEQIFIVTTLSCNRVRVAGMER